MKLPLFLILLLLLGSCTKGVKTSVPIDALGATLKALTEEAIEDSFDQISGVSMSVITPTFQWTVASGYDSDSKENPLVANQPFRIASITKTYVASAILRLQEMDSLNIDQAISTYISKEHFTLLIQEGYNPNQIKIKHCLNHTSGLYNYAQGSNTYLNTVKNDPFKKWTRTEQIEKAMRWGNKLCAPGNCYDYSDTGYILLGEIIEKYFGGDLGLGLRSLLNYEDLDLKSTWLEDVEQQPSYVTGPLVHRYYGKIDATSWDASIDLYGGGGLVSTTNDLAKFYHQLLNNQVFEKPETKALLLSESFLNKSPDGKKKPNFKDYRYGLWKTFIYGESAYMHTGLWGTTAIHIPSYNITIAANFTNGNSERMIKKALLVLINSLNS